MATIVQQHPTQPAHSHLPQGQLTPVLTNHLPPTLPPPPVAHTRQPVVLPTPATSGPQAAPPPAAPPSTEPSSAAVSATHHHHIHVHSHPQPPAGSSSKGIAPEAGERESRDREETALSRSSSSSSERKRSRIVMEEASVVPAEDRNAWYYPAAPRPAASIEGNNEQELDPGASTGNWGNKHVKGARWVEDRARKRLRNLLPDQSRASSPPLPTLPHLRAPTPPLVAPYAIPPKTHKSYTSMVVDPSVQHAYMNKTVASLGRTATEFIEGEGALRIALGALWQATAIDNKYSPSSNDDTAAEGSPRQSMEVESVKHGSGARDEPDAPLDNPDVQMSSGEHGQQQPAKTQEELLVASLSPLRQLFISTTPVTVPVDGAPNATLASASQLESFEWAINVLRDLTDDTREYMDRLEEVRELTGKAGAVRKDVWRVIKEKALEELEAVDNDKDDVQEESDY
ncbi:hypothetical protein FRC05_011251 [Tulasnella sp. 425]|nr:hypothetical protein FRC05_011251 [Tulasnella sp. 425]